MQTTLQPMTLGQHIRKARDDKGYSQIELAKLINEQTGERWVGQEIYGLESGRWRVSSRHRQPTHTILETIIQVLDLDPGLIILWDALAGNIHPVVRDRLTDPDFAATVYRLATRH